jgi:hypothetical protein
MSTERRYIVLYHHLTKFEHIEDAYSAADALTQHRARYPDHHPSYITVSPYHPRETPCKYVLNRARQPPGRFCCCSDKGPGHNAAPHYHFGVDERQPDGVECTCREACQGGRWVPHIHDGDGVRAREPQP